MVRAKKHFGQHFLKDEGLALKICDSLQLQGENYEQVLEIGPGMGVLTKHLLPKYGKNLYVSEIDADMVDYLLKHYPELDGNILQDDFLKVDLGKTFQGNFAVIGNFPYNISSQILFRILEYKSRVPEMVGMFQKEVAVRITGKEGNKDYGILSVLIQAFYNTEYLFTVHEGSFSPPPKVKSAVIRLTSHIDSQLKCNEKLFFSVVKAAFNQRRKTLRNALKVYGTKLENVPSEILAKRAEELTVQQFIELASLIEKN